MQFVAEMLLGSDAAMTRNPDLIQWHPASWQSKPAQQQATYRGSRGARSARSAQLSRLPPLVVSWEIEALQEQHRGGPARRALPAPGRRLRRDLRGLRVRQDRQEAEDPAADEPGAGLRPEEAGHPRRPHGRPVRQAALGGHRDARRRDAAELSRRHHQPSGLHAAGARARIRSCCCAATSAPR